jgi:predicted phage terminase large subunit-like protein
MSDFLGRPPARPRPQPKPDQARTLEMLATLFLVALVVAMLYVGREIFIPIAIAIPVSFVLSPPILLLRRWGLGRVPSVLTVVIAGLVIAFLVSAVLTRQVIPSTLLIEDSPISLGLIQSLREQSINVTTYKPDTDKRARLIAQTDLFAGGSVRLPRRAGWLEEFVAELLSFPGRHDDQVDALTQGLAWGRQQWSRKAIVSFYRY